MIIRDGWGSPNPVFGHFFTSSFIPDGDRAERYCHEFRRTRSEAGI